MLSMTKAGSVGVFSLIRLVYHCVSQVLLLGTVSETAKAGARPSGTVLVRRRMTEVR